jgi:hypothetical protein
MKPQANSNTPAWSRATGLWPTRLPSGDLVLQGGGYRVHANARAAEPRQPPYLLFQRSRARTTQLQLPLLTVVNP